MPSSRSRRACSITSARGALAIASLVGLAGVLGCGASPKADAPAPTTAATQAATPVGKDFGVLLMAHGGSPEWDAGVLEAVAPLREKYAIEVAFGMADAASLQDAVRKLEAKGVRKIGVVRLFVSGESFVDETEKIFGLRPGAPPASAAGSAVHPIALAMMDAGSGGHGGGAPGAAHGHGAHAPPAGSAAPSGHDPHAGGAHGAHAGHGGGHGGHSMAYYRVDTHSTYALSLHGLADADGMGTILADRAAALSKAAPKEDVLILAHGPGDDGENGRWIAKLDARAGAIRTRAPFRRVQVETLREDWPDKRAAAETKIRAFVERAKAEGGTAIVIPFRVQGFGPYADVLHGLDYTADKKGLIPHAEVTKWIEREIVAVEQGPFRTPG